MELDSRGRFDLSDSTANKVYQLDRAGKVLRVFGNLPAQKPGSYDRLSFISPGKLATWTDKSGADRLIVVEQGGPNRVSEWSDDGQLLRVFLTLQTKANDGYAIDVDDPGHIYIGGQQNWLTRFKINRDRGQWVVDAVWPHVGDDPHAPGFDHPQLINFHGHKYLACARSYNIYRLQDDRWILSAAIISELKNGSRRYFLWHDEYGKGRIEESEYHNHPLAMPGALLRYHGEQWLDNLSLVALDQSGTIGLAFGPTIFYSPGRSNFQKLGEKLPDRPGFRIASAWQMRTCGPRRQRT